ncbi:MAG: ABC transporter permease subunit/CPBP intramembrane protease [Planctomycetaceae bacterium]
MTRRNVLLIFLREVRDQLRDRRTLFMVAILPMLLYPALGIGIAQMTTTFSEQQRTVAIIGFDELPPPPLLDPTNRHRFVDSLFDTPADASKLFVITEADLAVDVSVITDETPSADENADSTTAGATAKSESPEPSKAEPAVSETLTRFLISARARRANIEELGRLTLQLDLVAPQTSAKESDAEPTVTSEASDVSDKQALSTLKARHKELQDEIQRWFRDAPVQVLIVVPQGYHAHLDQVNKLLKQRRPLDDFLSTGPRPIILQNSANDKSMVAYGRVRSAVRNWSQQALRNQLVAAELPASLPSAVDTTMLDMAVADEISASLWSKLFPTLLMMMAVTGAFYPAVDLGAGEKERGTMETLLISPATRTEIVIGKFLTVLLFSLSTAFLNIASMGLTAKYMLNSATAGRLANLGDVASFPPVSSLVWVAMIGIPLAAMFSALSLAFAMFARSTKEGQYYLTPLLMVTMGLTMFTLSPTVELNAYYSVLPIVGPGLLLKTLLLSQTMPNMAAYIVAVLGSSIVYSALALWWAIEQFAREDILFREAERFDLKLWVKHLFRDKEPTPTFSEAGLCLVTILMLVFVFMGVGAGQTFSANAMQDALIKQGIFLMVAVGVPPLLMAILLTRNPLETLKLRWPEWRYLVVAVGLAFVLQPISLELAYRLSDFFPPVPEVVTKFMSALKEVDVPWWMTIAALALAPALFEELAFRGFILSGLQRARNPWVAIVLSSLAFGAIHMIPSQAFNAMLMGIAIGLLAVTSRSLIPGILLHFLYNASQILVGRFSTELETTAASTDDFLFSVVVDPEGKVVGYDPHFPLLFPCVLAGAILLAFLVRRLRRQEEERLRLQYGDPTPPMTPVS